MLKRCTFIPGMTIVYDDAKRVVIVNDRALYFSRDQYTLLKLLLSEPEVHDRMFCRDLYQQDADSANRTSLRKSISKIRAQLRSHGLDIKRIYSYGYRLDLIQE
jgi:DNA-binding response OmpR family regulator